MNRIARKIDPEEDLKRRKYWNDGYAAYWRNRVNEANDSDSDKSALVQGDGKTSADSIYLEAIGLLNLSKDDHVLELGCGFGRSVPALCQAAARVTAADISDEMIAIARAECSEPNVTFVVSPSEDLPFQDDSFDVILCFAAFDAMYQAEALLEISRVTKSNGRVLITGKSDNYFDDDLPAYQAEIGARAKGHPNYFTDVPVLIANMAKFGLSLIVERYYCRRGDFLKGVHTGITNRPDRFYEYLFVIRKSGGADLPGNVEISTKVSKTAKRISAA
jgi:SAM-dependent methyltransferase